MPDKETIDLLHGSSEGSSHYLPPSRTRLGPGDEFHPEWDAPRKYHYAAGSWENRFILFLAKEGLLAEIEKHTELVTNKDLHTYLSERSFLDYFDEDVNTWYSKKWAKVSDSYFYGYITR